MERSRRARAARGTFVRENVAAGGRAVVRVRVVRGSLPVAAGITPGGGGPARWVVALSRARRVEQ